MNKLKMFLVMHKNSTINRIKCNASEILKKANIVLNKVYVHCKVSMTNIINVNETMNK